MTRGDKVVPVDKPERILIIRPSALGDVCRSVPIAAAIKKHRPNSEIHWLVNAPYAQVIEAHPAVSRIIPFDRKALGAQMKRLNFRPILRFLRSLRQEKYEIVIDAQGLARSGFFAFSTGARTRIGHADARELGWLGLNRRVPPEPDQHTVDRMMALLKPLGISEPTPDMRLYSRPTDAEWVNADAELKKPYLAIAPTSIWPGKRWPIERFVELAQRLTGDGHRLVVLGAPGEEAYCTPLLELASLGLPIIDRVGSTTTGQMLAIIERAQAVVANDSAAVHMAVGFDRPFVGLLGATHPLIFGPYRRSRDIIQHARPGEWQSFKHTEVASELMTRITVDEVHSRVQSILASGGAGSSQIPVS
ncbi:MAG: glycosyltransferase family 9 protein [Phycisphaerales bacterium]|nr:glycosyltransferase family 9 protein [Phycisphaerales bacterium]MCB9836490.1 glycosyltransferase family 9 protein [Phycisphaera sp.]